jgi:hypothetical protein
MVSARTALVGMVVLVGCKDEVQFECADIVADTTQHPNSAAISWETPFSGTVSVSYQSRSGPEHTLDLSAATDTTHSGVLFGLTSLTEYAYTLTATGDEDTLRCSGSFTTENMPPELPEVIVEVNDTTRTSSETVLIVSVMNKDETFPVAINRTGQVVWFTEDVFYEQVSQVEVAHDGRGLAMGSFSFNRGQDNSVFHRVGLLGEPITSFPIAGSHHFFKQRADGTVAHPSIDIRDWIIEGESVSVVGDALVEVRGADAVELFNVWDVMEPREHSRFWSNFYPQGADWTHLNSIDYLSETDQYIVSLPYLKIVLEIDANTGDVTEEFSPQTYTFEAHPFYEAHDVRMLDASTMTVLNQNPGGAVAVEYAIDRASKTLQVDWVYETGINVKYLGQFFRLENGNRIINYGSAGIIQEVTEGGEVVWEVYSPLGYWFGNGQMLDSLYVAAVP